MSQEIIEEHQWSNWKNNASRMDVEPFVERFNRGAKLWNDSSLEEAMKKEAANGNKDVEELLKKIADFRPDEKRKQKEDEEPKQKEDEEHKQKEEEERKQKEEEESKHEDEEQLKQEEEEERKVEEDSESVKTGGQRLILQKNAESPEMGTLLQLLTNKTIKLEDWQLLGIDGNSYTGLKDFLDWEKDLSIGNLMQKSKPVRNSRAADICFVGVPRSGKSSILAAVMHQLQKSGDLVPAKNISVKDQTASTYGNYLRRCSKNNCLPNRTEKDTILAIPFDVFHDGVSNEVRHSWNFIEMAGEHVTSAKKEGKTQELDKQGWLKRKAHKVVNFVIDPTYRPTQFCPYEQEEVLLTSAIALKELGVIDKATIVNVIVTKFDTVDGATTLGREEWNDHCLKYIEQEYSTFRNLLKDYQNKKNWLGRKKELFKIKPVPFSIGENFWFGRFVQDWDEKSAKSLIETFKQETPYA